MADDNRNKDELPDEFASYEEAAEFWDTHDVTDYLEDMEPVEVDGTLRKRHYEIEMDDDVVVTLAKKARSRHIPAARLANELLRKALVPTKVPHDG